MKRFVTTLAILLVVIVAGMTALVLLVNPNDFRDYMARQVEQRSGYQLALKGKLRWHVWPQLSILSGPLTLTAPGASQPLVSAENMRLDVHLWPLLSHQLSVRQVMLKNAVVRLTPESERQQPKNSPVAPGGAVILDNAQGWTFDLGELRMADSLIIWQQSSGEQINIRDVNLQLSQNSHRQAHIEMSSRISRDQRELVANINADMDVTRYPRQLHALINQLDYQFSGADLPAGGVKGQAKMALSWLAASHAFDLSKMTLSANDSQLSGSIRGVTGARPRLQLMLHAPLLNIDSLIGLSASEHSGLQQAQIVRSGGVPVIARGVEESDIQALLKDIDSHIAITADTLRWQGNDFNKVTLDASLDDGVLALKTFTGNLGKGHFSLPGRIDVQGNAAIATLQPVFSQVDVATLLNMVALPVSLSGDLSFDGNFSGVGLNATAFKRDWQGNATLRLDRARVVGLDFQQMIQRGVERANNKVRGTDPALADSTLQQISSVMSLKKGTVKLSALHGRSSMLNYDGEGKILLPERQIDMAFGVKVTAGWQGDEQLIQHLQQTPVLLRIYGPWSDVNYALQVDKLFRQQLQDEAKKRLKNWVARKRIQDSLPLAPPSDQ